MPRSSPPLVAVCSLLGALAASSTAHAQAPGGPERPVLIIDGGAERYLSRDEADRAGYTRVSLRDDWTPYLFEEPPDPQTPGARLGNRYRATYLGLANDRTDEDGLALPAGAHNYLELYGIPPTMGVLSRRFLADAEPGHCANVDLSAIRAVGSIAVGEKKRATGAGLAALAQIEERLACECLLPARRRATGLLDDTLRKALVRFQQKHMIYDATPLRADTLAALGRPILDGDHGALVRAFTERLVAAANLLEDGSAVGKDGKPATFVDEKGQVQPVPDTVGEALAAATAQLGWQGPEEALAFFRRHPASEFAWLEVGVKLPPPPPYHSAEMDLSVEIDRGDVIYDPLYDDDGKETNQSREHFPMLTLRARWNGQLIPLVHWRTTIGGWRSDLAPNGYEYYRYKGSDVGPRIWRHIVAGPVWNAPPSTPIRSLVKDKPVNGSHQTVVNYDEVGPGFLSAYGLVVAYNVEPGRNGKPDGDNGVRVHGSSEYLSIRRADAYSHGCHRLMNHLAVRLFTFVLRHRHVKVLGEKALGFSRRFLWRDQVYEMRLPSKGFHFELDPPVPVNVLEGNIRGKARKPILTYKPKPGVVYPPGPPPLPPDLGGGDARAGGG